MFSLIAITRCLKVVLAYQKIVHAVALLDAIKLVWEPVLMLVLLTGSAFFSGAETAFFNLSRRQIRLLAESKHAMQKLAAKLLNRPRVLLGCFLLGNMTVNVLFFAAGSVFVLGLQRQAGSAIAAAAAFVSFAVLVIFGEILPKSIAFASSKTVSIAAAVPTFLFLEILSPIVLIFRFTIAEPVLRLLLGPKKARQPLTTEEFQSLIEQIRRSGLISADENKLLNEVIELGFLKVRDCLRPRVDMIACAITDSTKKARTLMHENHLTKLPVFVRRIDNVVGTVSLRHLLLRPQATISQCLRDVPFVPEQKKVESLLEFFRSSGADMAIVVDEYGGIAGWVTLEDIAEELLGPTDTADRTEPIEQTGPFEYRLSGDLAIHDWANSFGIITARSRLSTVGGLVTALLGRIPKAGDTTHLKNLKFTVEQVQSRRIKTLILTLEPIKSND